MRGWIVVAGAALALGTASGALAQGEVIAERRGGLRQMGQHMEAIAAVLQNRGDQRQIAGRVDQMTPSSSGCPTWSPRRA